MLDLDSAERIIFGVRNAINEQRLALRLLSAKLDVLEEKLKQNVIEEKEG